MALKKRIITFFTIIFPLVVTAAAFGLTVNYQYDDLYRLTRVESSDGSVTTYQYDASGNRISKTTTFDITLPASPVVSGVALTNNLKPVWSWSSAGGGNGTYRYKLDSSDLTIGATETIAISYIPQTNLFDGLHTLYVQERDAAVNWSVSGSYTITVDTAAPTVAIGSPSATVTKSGPETYTVTYAGADSITLVDANVTLNKTGTANGTVAVSGTGNTARMVTISGITGDGTLGISIAAGTAGDSAGNFASESGASVSFTVDNTSPVISTGENQTKNGVFTQTGTATDVNAVIYSWAKQSGPGTVIFGAATGLSTTIQTSLEGTYTIRFTATDAAGNSSFSDMTLVWDTTPPTAAIGSPSATVTKSGPVTYAVTYTGADAVTLAGTNVTLIKTGTANGTIAVSGTGNTTRTVTISGITGDGTLGISIASGTSSDNAGNLALAAGPSVTCTVDNKVIIGDINGDVSVDLKDAILALQSLSRMNPPGIRFDYALSGADVNNDGKIGLEEALYILQFAAGLRAEAPATYAISGRITAGGVVAFRGVTVTLSGIAWATTTTDANGIYTFTGVPNGSYTVTPSFPGYTFNSSNRAVTVNSTNVTDQGFVATAAVTDTISGTITAGGVALAGVTVTLSGASSAITTTDASGNYTFTGLANGSHTLTPSKAGYTFTPGSMTVTINGWDNAFSDFLAESAGYSVSGMITSGGVALSGVTVTLYGTHWSRTTTDENGNYTLTKVPPNCWYTITPSYPGYIFNPSNREVIANNTNVTDQDFVTAAAPATVAISGRITAERGAVVALPGVTVTLSGTSSAVTSTDASGNYTFTEVPNGSSYTVTPSFPGYTFNPSNREGTVNNTNVTDQDFVAAAAPSSTLAVSGTITVESDALPGVTVTLSGTSSAVTSTDASGNYTFTGILNDSYTVTPSCPDYTFNPSNRAVTVNNTNVAGQDFVTTAAPSTVVFRTIYGRYFQLNPKIAKVSIDKLDPETSAYFWSYLEELELKDAINMAKPVGWSSDSIYVNLTGQEAKKIIAAKHAHAVWLDRNNLVPWKLDSYTESELAGLFDPALLFHVYEPENDNINFFYVVDYSPSEPYKYARDLSLIKADALSTFYAVADDLRTTDNRTSFIHNSSFYGDIDSAYSVYEALTTWEDRVYAKVRVSRHGCWTMSMIMLDLLRSINIPGMRVSPEKWFLSGHASAEWPSLGIVLYHGDEMYDGLFNMTPTNEMFPTYETYNEKLYTDFCGDLGVCISERFAYLKFIAYPSSTLLEYYCYPENYNYASCKAMIEDKMKPSLTVEELTKATDLCNHCPSR